jgi:hypothetical protein
MPTANLISNPISYKVSLHLVVSLCHEFRLGSQAIITSAIDEVSDQLHTWTAVSRGGKDRDAVRFQNLCASCGKETSLFSLQGIQPRFVGILVRNLVSVPSESSRLLCRFSKANKGCSEMSTYKIQTPGIQKKEYNNNSVILRINFRN